MSSTSPISVRLTPEERAKLDEMARTQRTGPSTAARRVIVEALKLPLPAAATRRDVLAVAVGKGIGELGRIGNLLNQVARIANARRSIAPDAAAAAYDRVAARHTDRRQGGASCCRAGRGRTCVIITRADHGRTARDARNLAAHLGKTVGQKVRVVASEGLNCHTGESPRRWKTCGGSRTACGPGARGLASCHGQSLTPVDGRPEVRSRSAQSFKELEQPQTCLDAGGALRKATGERGRRHRVSTSPLLT